MGVRHTRLIWQPKRPHKFQGICKLAPIGAASQFLKAGAVEERLARQQGIGTLALLLDLHAVVEHGKHSVDPAGATVDGNVWFQEVVHQFSPPTLHLYSQCRQDFREETVRHCTAVHRYVLVPRRNNNLSPPTLHQCCRCDKSSRRRQKDAERQPTGMCWFQQDLATSLHPHCSRAADTRNHPGGEYKTLEAQSTRICWFQEDVHQSSPPTLQDCSQCNQDITVLSKGLY
jgi:hypothetical protein